MAIQQSDLFCEEEGEAQWEDELDETEELIAHSHLHTNNLNKTYLTNNPLLSLLEQDFQWEDEELVSLFSKEKQTHLCLHSLESDPFLFRARTEAVDWILNVKHHYGFSVLTAVLAINYLDRYLSNLLFHNDKPWMIQLVAVTCLSLAAKIEEIHVPLLLDLQVEDAKYVFEAKTIQRMELRVMSNLEWRMNPVTPLSFLDHIIRRLGLNTNLHWDFYQRCQDLIITAVADWRSVSYLPSVLATATMFHVIHQVEPSNPTHYLDQLLGVLQTTKEEVNECYKLIMELSKTCLITQKNPHKRKYEESPGSPSGVIDSYFSCSDNSNDSWDSCITTNPLFKKNRVEEQSLLLSSLSRVFDGF